MVVENAISQAIADARYLKLAGGTMTGNIAMTGAGTVDGVDVSVFKTAYDSHTHDGRYYTETEVDTWRNSVTQTEMGYVAGVTSDVQTQFGGKLSLTGGTMSGAIAMGTNAISGATSVTATSFVIGANSLDTNEWAFLDGQDQALKVADSVEFAQVTLTGIGKVIFGAAGQNISSVDADYMDYAAATAHRFAADIDANTKEIWAAKVGIGTVAVPHGGVGAGLLALEGANASTAGPHVQFTTASDDYPLMQMLMYTHDAVDILFDAYWDGAFKSSDAGSNFMIQKASDEFRIRYDSGVAQGGAVSFATAFAVEADGDVMLSPGAALKTYWRDTGLHISSPGDGIMALVTDGTITLGAAATNQLIVEADGSQEWIGAATMWDDANLGAIILERGASAPDIISINTSTIRAPAFDGNATVEQLSGAIEMPHSWKEESSITPHVHFMPTTADAGNIHWQLEYEIIGPGETAGGGTIITKTIAAGGVAWDEVRADFAAITMTGKVTGTQIAFRLFRNPVDGADTYGEDAAVLTVGFHFEKDRPGSRQIATK